MAEDVIPSIAARYRVSEDAARQVEQALRRTGGRQAQFDHPDLGGSGQWMPGMVMVGSMGDEALRTRVSGLCAEIAAVVRGDESSSESLLSREPDLKPSGACATEAVGESWWPASFGEAGASGEQQGVRYACFPDARRLLVQIGSRIDCYDTADHRISGVSQHQGASTRLAFSSQRGDVPLESLRCIPHEEWVGR